MLMGSPKKTPLVEIGPGPGALTEEILKRGHTLVAVEIDPRMAEHLRSRFAHEIQTGQFTLLHKDALTLKAADFSFTEDYVICGNLPYNVGSPIVFNFLEQFPKARGFCFMLQKEVVQKFLPPTSARGPWSTPAIKMDLLCQVKGHFWVKPGSFSPPPKVDSGVISYARKTDSAVLVSPFSNPSEYSAFSNFLMKAFAQKRKMLRAAFPQLKNDPVGVKRAEELSPQDFFSLFKTLKATQGKLDPS
jgi:16S rRNA (adenine1518-N6/adenine1519-N6)-dimethyltransferase